MANRLKAELTFANVAAGATATLAHGLNLNGTGLIPDRVVFDINSAGFDVSAVDDTNLTVINNNGFVATAAVLVERWHSIERVFGDSALAIVTGGLTPRPLVSGVGPGAGAGRTDVFTYICTGAEGSDFFIPLPAARVDDNYVPRVSCGGVATILAFNLPDLAAADRTTLQFRVIASAAVQIGDRLDVTVFQRTA